MHDNFPQNVTRSLVRHNESGKTRRMFYAEVRIMMIIKEFFTYLKCGLEGMNLIIAFQAFFAAA